MLKHEKIDSTTQAHGSVARHNKENFFLYFTTAGAGVASKAIRPIQQVTLCPGKKQFLRAVHFDYVYRLNYSQLR